MKSTILIWGPRSTVFGMVLLFLLTLALEGTFGNYTSRFTIEELLTTDFPRRISEDVDMDPGKADGFLGDIVVPNIIYDLEIRAQKINQTFIEELEKYKKQMLLEKAEIEEEGLQIEEEGLEAMQRVRQLNDKKLKAEDIEVRASKENIEEKQVTERMVLTTEGIAFQRVAQPRGLMPVKTPKQPTPLEIDDEFEQVEPKYNPYMYEKETNIAPEDSNESWRSRLHKERRRRIQHTGQTIAPATEHKTRKHKIIIDDETTKRMPDMIKDDSKAGIDVLQEVLREANKDELRRGKRKERKGKKSGRRKNDKRLNSTDGKTKKDQTDGDDVNRLENIPATEQAPVLRRHEQKKKKKLKKNRQDGKTESSVVKRRMTRAATARKERIWDYGVIPYEIDGNFSGGHKALFKQAMRHWENFTCVKFVERNDIEHPNYIYFTERACGCCSFVGKRGNGPQAISIGKNCDKFGIVVHELGHVVGFWHEHTRPDRDRHVDIIRDHIMEGQEYNFNKLSEDEVNSLGLPYDYDSIMHYARNTFSKGTYLDTIQPLVKYEMSRRPEIGQRIRLSDGDIAQTNLLYKCPKCGRTFQENSASFSHPAITSDGSGVRCEWRITATHGEKIVLNITELDIYHGDNCHTDYLEIRDGYWNRSPVIGKFCGKRKPAEGSVISTASRLSVSLVTTLRSEGFRGFAASYEAVCGGDIYLTEARGHLESPNFPEDYQPGKECVWNIQVQDGYQIALKFQTFEVENHDSCVYDYVEVRDGHGYSAPVLGTYCGYKLPPDIKSTGNTLSVKFVSDGSVQKAGFSASFILEQDECSAPGMERCEQQCVNTLGGYECACRIGFDLHSDGVHCEQACGGVIDAINGSLTSPHFPSLYPKNKRCVWEIIAPPQYRITINFTHFDFEGNNFLPQECEFDKVEVHSKIREDFLRRHGVFCGTRTPPLITSESNSLRVEFTSDGTVEKSGFAAIFFTDIDECAVDNGGCQHECHNTIGSFVCSCHNGFNLHDNGRDCKEGGCKFEIKATSGQIQSPNYPDYYPPRKDCVWLFSTTPGHRIRLTFSHFELEPHQECAYDHIAIYDGDSPDSHTLGRFCGAKTPHPIIATGNQMYMAFKSDTSVQRKGFLATHTTVCGGHLQATSTAGQLYSHAKYGHQPYGERMDCDWSIEAPPGKTVHLTFLTFEVEEEQDCNYDYVEVYSGLDASGPNYGRFCGSSTPAEIYSLYEALVVRFRTDDSIVAKGFSASYIAVDPMDSEEFGDKFLKFQDDDY